MLVINISWDFHERKRHGWLCLDILSGPLKLYETTLNKMTQTCEKQIRLIPWWDTETSRTTFSPSDSFAYQGCYTYGAPSPWICSTKLESSSIGINMGKVRLFAKSSTFGNIPWKTWFWWFKIEFWWSILIDCMHNHFLHFASRARAQR